jgi:mannose-1-phosphate guanylyltransferase
VPQTSFATGSALHAIVLAGGSGSRVAGLTRDREGRHVPKQYAVVSGGRTMIQAALGRARRLVPEQRTLAVVAREHHLWWRRELVTLPTANVVVQPQNRGTAAGLLLPLLRVLQRDPEPRVLVLPSDHHVEDEAALERAITEAVEAVGRDHGRVVLLGAAPKHPDTEYGWVVPRRSQGGLLGVEAFVEKPDREAASRLMARGALLNTAILVAGGRTLVQLYTRHLPGLLGAFAAWRDEERGEGDALERLYHTLPTHDFSREVLTPAASELFAVPISDCGFMDLGTPARLEDFRSRVRTVDRPLVERLQPESAGALR